MADRPRRFPFFRVGMLLVLGAVAVSIFQFYVGFGYDMADMSTNEAMPESREELASYFYRKFFLTGSLATAIFWGGLAIAAIGISARVFRAGRKPEPL